ncbi:hypothetical protein QVD17_29046 [Tagetes erecta]|uniref:Uncharacterized protein n=1 Tax=Tagetes erecta TaxID=13708 RepID=A0AAD8KBH3_TARER|nr:hypothetical protein QVD17_29046 [Tagetes erecta]
MLFQVFPAKRSLPNQYTLSIRVCGSQKLASRKRSVIAEALNIHVLFNEHVLNKSFLHGLVSLKASIILLGGMNILTIYLYLYYLNMQIEWVKLSFHKSLKIFNTPTHTYVYLGFLIAGIKIQTIRLPLLKPYLIISSLLCFFFTSLSQERELYGL